MGGGLKQENDLLSACIGNAVISAWNNSFDNNSLAGNQVAL